MMEYARTAIKSSIGRIKSNKAAAGVILVFLIFLGVVIWRWSEQKPPVGRLRAVKKIAVSGVSGLKAIADSPDGKLYIADSRNDRIIVMTEKGRRVQIINNKTLKYKETIKNPVAVAVNKDKVWIGCYGTKRILVLNRAGKLIDVLPHQNEQEGLKTIAPLVLTTDQAGNLYAVDGEKHTITVFNSSGKINLVFGGQGFAEDKFNHINGLVVDEKHGRLIIQDSGNLRLVFTTMEGKFLSQTVFMDKGQHLFAAPRGLEYEPRSGVIYMADALLDRVFALDEQGGIIANSRESLSYPQALVLGKNGFLYVANREDKSIIKMNP